MGGLLDRIRGKNYDNHKKKEWGQNEKVTN